MKHSLRKVKEGGILLIVMLMLLVLSVFGLGLMRLADADALKTATELHRTQAFWLADAGLREFVAIVEEPRNRKRLDRVGTGLIGSGVISKTIPDKGSYSVDIIEDFANIGSGIKGYTVRATGTTLSGQQSSVAMHALTETWSVFTYASHIEGNIWFASGDEIGEEGKDNGIQHTNGKFKINGTPKIWAEARSAHNRVDYNDGRNEYVGDPNVFKNGLELRATEVDFSERNFEHLKEIIPPAHRLSGNYAIEFDDEVYYLTEKSTGNITTNFISSINPELNERIIYVEGDIEVKGNVGTAVSIAAEGSLFITDDIVYTSSMEQDNSDGHKSWDESYQPEPDEVLGLFSGERVQVSEGWDIGDVHIHATILVTDPDNGNTTYGGFGADWDGSRRYSYTKPYGELYLYGSLSQYERAAVGLVGGKGYTKRYNYDSRLTDNPPPGTPYSAFIVSQWRQL